MSWTVWIILGAISGGLSVVFGAFGAHALKGRLSAEALATFETGVRYQMYHALALIAIGLIAVKLDNTALKIAGSSVFAGMLIFSCSLYGVSLLEIRWLGMVAPIGGALLIIGWFALAWAALAPSL
jgi:uncharacterized membrane protein YgdD (TMEM256/DUF423 family)